MFAVRRIFRSNTPLTNYICTSSVLQSDGDKKISNLFRRGRKSKTDWETRAKDKTNLRPQTKERSNKNSHLSEAMVSSVGGVARELGGNEEQTKKELMDYVRMLDAEKDPEIAPEVLDSNIKPKSMKNKEWFEANQIPKETPEREEKRKKNGGIFKKKIMNVEDAVQLKIWDSLKEEELAAKSKRAPENYYEELINWTNEGRLWKFPIDNDQGMEKEASVSFTEHVFLERHLEPWCPKKGPIRKFMEMVLIGLQKNPYYTAKEKRAHIMWFKFYFDEKKKLLQELGAMGPTKLEVSSQKSDS